MVELRDIVQSDDLNAAIETFEVAARRHARYRKPAKQPAFSKIALGKTFQADKAAAIISKNDPSYPGICEVLFLGFCGWAIAPEQDVPRLVLMSHGVLDHVANAEREAGVWEEYSLKAEITARYILVGPDFLDDVYDAIGSHAGFSDNPVREYLEDMLLSERRSLMTIVRACGIFHYATDNLANRALYKRISLSTVVDVMRAERLDETVEKTIFWEKWKKCKSTVALIYTASTIERDGVTLLDSILDGQVTAQTYMKSFDEWLRKARYYCEHVLGELNVKALFSDNMKPLTVVAAHPFDPPAYEDDQVMFLKRKFSEK